jgi:hypothetical protein
MAEALKVHSTFKRLDMSDNMIGDVGALALAEASKNLESNSTLNECHCVALPIEVQCPKKIGIFGGQAPGKSWGRSSTIETIKFVLHIG